MGRKGALNSLLHIFYENKYDSAVCVGNGHFYNLCFYLLICCFAVRQMFFNSFKHPDSSCAYLLISPQGIDAGGVFG